MGGTEDIIVAVMGMTGTGKSSFIKSITGDSSILVEDKLHSGTQEVKPYYYTAVNNIKYTIVDTPGFDDPKKPDAIVVDKILQWLESSFRQGKRLSGIIYLHRISDPKMEGTALQNLRMFRKLCGPDCFKNVVLATTFWNKVMPATGEEREKELRENDEFWGQMVKKKSKMVRLYQDKGSAHSALGLIRPEEKMTLQAQSEVVLKHKPRDETAAAAMVQEQARRLAEERQQVLREEEEKARRLIAEREAERRSEAEAEKTKMLARIKSQEEENRKREAEKQWKIKKAEKEKERLREEAVKKELERVAKEKAAVKAREAAQIQAQRDAEAAARRRRQQYYTLFRCAGISPRGKCDKCGCRLSSWKYYFHCCHCYPTDDYWQCGPCGNICKVAEHPIMRQGTTDDCIVM